MEHIEEEVKLLLEGAGVEQVYIDTSPPAAVDFVPRTKETVGYIVSAVLINDKDEILMMQEAKQSCYGYWYLPAGRMEKNETIMEAVKREVEEETGVEMEPTTLLSVEVGSGCWYRFTLTGIVTGGKVKSLADKDTESLQSRWCSWDLIKANSRDLPLRNPDILKLIKIAKSHRDSSVKHPQVLPVEIAHSHLVLRLVVVSVNQNDSSSELSVLVSKKGPKYHVPLGMLSPRDFSLMVAVYRMLKDAFNERVYPNICGLLTVEYNGKPARLHDGICLALLLTLTNKEKQRPTISNESYEWHQVTDDLKARLQDRMQPQRTVPFLLLA